MKKFFYSRRAQANFEVITMIVFIIGAFLVFQKYITFGLSGRWKQIGDSFGQGRLYSKSKTIECLFDYQYYNLWYDADCFEANCDCQSVQANDTTCKDCMYACGLVSSELEIYCTQLCNPQCAASCTDEFGIIDPACIAGCNSACKDTCIATQPTYDACGQ